MNPTPPDRSVEEAVEEYRKKMGEIGMRSDWQIGDEWLRKKLTSLYHQGIEAGIRHAVELSDKIELEEPDGGIEQWKAFKRFRNTLHDRLATLNETV